jgi:hypothetical protein
MNWNPLYQLKKWAQREYHVIQDTLEDIAENDLKNLVNWLEFTSASEAFIGINGRLYLGVLRKIAQSKGISEQRVLTDALDASSIDPSLYKEYRSALERTKSK